MAETLETLAPGRLALLARAAVEGARYAAPERAALERSCREALDALEDGQRRALLAEAALLAPGQGAVRPEAAAAVEQGAAVSVLRQRASLELQLKAEQERCKEIEQAYRREQAEHAEAVEALGLQQRKVKELQEERARLLGEVGALESKLRAQLSATEQAELKYEKLKASRQSVGAQATELLEQVNALKADNERLKRELEAVLQQRDQELARAQGAQAQAEAESAAAVFAELWRRLHAEIPELFVETHVATAATFEQLGEAFVEFVRAFAVLELHVHHLLRDLRQVSEKSDKLNHFYIMFTKNPGLLETLKDYLVTGKRKGNFVNLLRALQAWARAFASGSYKVIVRSPVTIAEELNYRSWPIKTSFTKTEDAAIGEYYKQTAVKVIPEKLGTVFRKQAGDMAYEDYNDLMKRK